MSDVLTREQVAELLQISPRTVTVLDIPFHRVGMQRRYLRAEVLAWVAAQPKEAA